MGLRGERRLPARLRWLSMAAMLVLAACSAEPAATPSATPGLLTPPPTTEASAPPTASLAPSPGATPPASPAATSPGVGTLDVLLPGAAVQVVVKELNLREKASTSSKRVRVLHRGDVLVISPLDSASFGYGPVRKNGFTWYPVVVTSYKNGTLPSLPTEPADFGGAEPTWGWVAADDGAQPFVTPLPPRCPATVDLASVQGMLPAERLACFGAPITLEGTYGCSGCGGAVAGTFKPAWIADPLSFGFLSVNPADRLGPLALRFPPKGPAEPPAGAIIRVKVHVDDARAMKCTMAEPADSGAMVPVDARTAILRCREELVVESYETLGTDPSFPPG
jgi:hypothetical protein